jgi:O-antigen ligase
LLAGIGLAVFIIRSRSTFAAFGGVFTVYCLVALFDLVDRFGAPITAVCTGLAGGLVVPRVVDLAWSVINAQSGSVSVRLQQYAYGASLLSENPLSGVGAGYFLARTGLHLHNFWLMMGVWSGVPGLFSWLCLFGLLWYRSLRLIGSPDGRVRAYGIAMLAAMAGVTIELLFFPGLNDALAVGIAVLLGPSRLGE